MRDLMSASSIASKHDTSELINAYVWAHAHETCCFTCYYMHVSPTYAVTFKIVLPGRACCVLQRGEFSKDAISIVACGSIWLTCKRSYMTFHWLNAGWFSFGINHPFFAAGSKRKWIGFPFSFICCRQDGPDVYDATTRVRAWVLPIDH